MQTPLVSIIIPTYNRAHLIGETLDSVIAQTYTNWECIVVDDGSTDTTDEVLQLYCDKDNRIKYYHRPKDRLPGGNAARNYGFEVSNGEYINWLDSDDYFYTDKIKIKVEYLIKYSCDIVISKHTRYFHDLSSIVTKFKIFDSESFDIDFIKSRNSVLIGDPMIKRHCLSKTRFDENLRRGQDHDFFIRLFRNKQKYCLLNVKLYYYRYTASSITLKAGAGDKEAINTQIQIHKKMLKYYSKNESIIFEYNRKTIKMYKSLIRKNKILRIIKHYNFFRNAFDLSFLKFSFWFLINTIFKKGFDRMKYKFK